MLSTCTAGRCSSFCSRIRVDGGRRGSRARRSASATPPRSSRGSGRAKPPRSRWPRRWSACAATNTRGWLGRPAGCAWSRCRPRPGLVSCSPGARSSTSWSRPGRPARYRCSPTRLRWLASRVRCWRVSSSALGKGRGSPIWCCSSASPGRGPCGGSWPGRSATRRWRSGTGLQRRGGPVSSGGAPWPCSGAGTFVDAGGATLPFPGAGSGRSAPVVERAGRPAAVLIHDPAVLSDQALLDAVAAAAQLESANARLNAEARAQLAELAASRRRILKAGDQARGRLERRLHDGAGRRLAELQETLSRGRLVATGEQTRDQIARSEDQLRQAVEELRLLAQGLHPRALSEHGLAGALTRLADGSPVPVEISVASRRLAPHVEAGAYFVCSEGLANVAKYAAASRAAISVTPDAGTIVIVVSDDGVGGADPRTGSGLTGLGDRMETLGGTFRVESTPGRGTRLAAEIPLGGQER